MSGLTSDVRTALRSLARTPGFAFVALLTLTLGIGANTVIFSFVNAVLLEPLPYESPDSLVRVYGESPYSGRGNVNPLDAVDFRERSRTLEDLSLHWTTETTVHLSDESLRVPLAKVSPSFFSLLGVEPSLGTTFSADAETPGSDKAVILSHGFWQTAFGGDSDVLGRTLRIADDEFEITGVLPQGFRTPLLGSRGGPLVWVPFTVDREKIGRGGHYIQAIGRLNEGRTLAEAEADLSAIAAALETEYADTNEGYGVTLVGLSENVLGESRRPLTILMLAVGFVLLIACSNLANLFLARGASRQRELAIRSSLGADRGRIVRQLATEAFLVAIVGASLAIGLSTWAIDLIRTLASQLIPRAADVTLDARVLLFTVLVTGVAILLAGVLPAAQVSESGAAGGLRETGRSGTVSRGSRRSMRALVVVQIALSLTLMVVAGLTLRSFAELTKVDTGFDTEKLATLRMLLGADAYPEDAQIVAFHQQLEERLERYPGVEAVGTTNVLPFSGRHSCDGYEIEGAEPDSIENDQCAEMRFVSAGFFETMGVGLLSGRGFKPGDENQDTLSIVVTKSMAQRLGDDPYSRRLKLYFDDAVFVRVVGVVEDVRHFGLAEEPIAEIYVPHGYQLRRSVNVVVRSATNARDVFPLIRTEVRNLDASIPLNNLKTLESLVSSSVARNRMQAILLGSFGVIALLLAASGIFGVLSYLVASERMELGVRLALGADAKGLVGFVVGDAVRMTVAGALLGVITSIGAAQVIHSQLFEISPFDPLTYLIVSLVLASAALLAALIPAVRAASLDPATVLRAN